MRTHANTSTQPQPHPHMQPLLGEQDVASMQRAVVDKRKTTANSLQGVDNAKGAALDVPTKQGRLLGQHPFTTPFPIKRLLDNNNICGTARRQQQGRMQGASQGQQLSRGTGRACNCLLPGKVRGIASQGNSKTGNAAGCRRHLYYCQGVPGTNLEMPVTGQRSTDLFHPARLSGLFQ